jgi:hypothetical protein
MQLIEEKRSLGVELGFSQVREPSIAYRGRYEFPGARFSTAPRRGPRVVKN